MIRFLYISLILAFIVTEATAQIGGKSSFEFLNQPYHARLAGIGGVNVSLIDHDVNMVNSNPALLNEQMEGQLSINYVPFYADINATSLAYAHKFKKAGLFATTFTYLNYGKMQETDPTGNVLGEFSAADYQFSVSYAHKMENFVLGATTRIVGANIESYNANAVALDLGAVFKHPEQDFNVGLTIRNIGYTFNRFTPEIRQNLPFTVQLGMNYKLEHMPLRFSITADNLQTLDIVYLDPSKRGTINANGTEVKPKKTITDQIARHFVFGGEFLLSKNFNIRFGYNHLIRKELRLENRAGTSGFSFGLMARVKAFELGYSRVWYHVAGGANYLTITSNLNQLFKRQTKS